MIMVIPSKDLVIVVTAGYFDDDLGGPAGEFIFDDIVFHRVLAAIH